MDIENIATEREAKLRFHEELTDPDLVYRRYFDHIHRYCRRRLPRHHDVEDICAEVFAEAFIALPTLSWRKKPLLAFLYTLARRSLANHWRKRCRFEVVPLDESYEMQATAPNLATLVNYGKLAPAIDQLPPDQRLGVYLQLVHGLSFAELSSIIGRKEKACKSLVYRGLANLRKTLQEEGIQASETDQMLETEQLALVG